MAYKRDSSILDTVAAGFDTPGEQWMFDLVAVSVKVAGGTSEVPEVAGDTYPRGLPDAPVLLTS